MNFDLGSVAAIAEKFGVGGAILIIFTIGVAYNLPKLIGELKESIAIILQYRLASRRQKEEIRLNKEQVLREIEAAKKSRES